MSIRFALSGVLDPVQRELDRYGITKALGPGASYETAGAALEAFHARNAWPSALQPAILPGAAVSIRAHQGAQPLINPKVA